MNLEGERLMRELVDRLRKESTVTVNRPAVEKLIAAGSVLVWSGRVGFTTATTC